MEEINTITCVLNDFSSLKDESCCSVPFTVAGYNWRFGVYFEGDDRYLCVFLQIQDTASLPPGWSRDVKFSFTAVEDNGELNMESDKAEGLGSFTKEAYTWGFKYDLVHDKSEYLEFLMNKRLHIIAYVQVLPAVVVPAESVKTIEEENQASDAYVLDFSCQVEQETENASKENLDETSDEDTCEDTDVDDDDDDDTSDEDANDDEGTDDDGSWEDVGPAINAALHIESDNTTEVTNSNNNDDTTEESSDDDDDDDSSLVSKDDAKDVTSLNQVKSLEGTSQTVDKGTETTNDLLEEIQRVEEINGFKVSSSQVEWVSRIFERHPDIASGFRPKNQEIRTVYMNQLVSLIETLCKSQEKLSLDDLSKAEETLCDITDVGFNLDWLKTKMNEVSEKKKRQEGSGAKVQAMEEELQKLKLMVLDLETQLQNSKAEALAARTPLSFDDVV